jgi:crotonobetainyl-CoA:carnitine CoA-transferase CaiB-like acyl-CoA transferase
MRGAATRRLGIDFESLREINPRLVYCHTRGYEHGERDTKPANDQTAAALAGTEWVDGAADSGGTPIWPSISLGDTGNGLLSAIGVLQALYHRDRTGEGQVVDTSIAYAHLLNSSMAWTTPDGTVSGDRPVVDAESWGIGPLHRIYPAAEGWLCLVVLTAGERRRLDAAVPAAAGLEGDALADALGTAFAGDTAEAWGKTLDAHGVPAEVCATAPGTVLFDDPDLKDRGLMTAYAHPVTGAMEMAGRLFDIVGVTASGRPPLLGEHSREILAELGVPDVDGLIEAGVVRG